jgi:transcriptional regulator with XRE-family HTH domain
MSKLSNVLREARAAKGWSQKEAAERSGVPLQTLSRYEKPTWEGRPSTEKVVLLAAALDISEDRWMAALDIPLRASIDQRERDDRYTEIVTLADDDPRFSIVAKMWKGGSDKERDAALSVMETIFNRPRRPPARRRRQANGQ